jgi:hypothetical protein
VTWSRDGAVLPVQGRQLANSSDVVVLHKLHCCETVKYRGSDFTFEPNSKLSYFYFNTWTNLVYLACETASRISYLGNYAFEACSLRSLCIPASVERTAKCFASCANLSDFIFEPNSKLSVRGDCAAEYCSSFIHQNAPWVYSCPHLSDLRFQSGSKQNGLPHLVSFIVVR